MNIGVVIVTYNRLDKLKKCLVAYNRQSFKPSFVLVYNNNSNDGTKDYLDEWKSINTPFEKIVIHSETNLGGAGGFTNGIKIASQYKCDWIWLADDDAYPSDDCLEHLRNYYTSLSIKEQLSIVALCAKVIDNSSISFLHRRKLSSTFLQHKEIPLSLADYQNSINEIDFFSFVGTAISTRIIAQAGLPREDYFIFYDDTEYSLRLKAYGKIKCLSDAVILHDSNENNIISYSWKNYYMFRNKLYTYRIYFKTRYCFVEYFKQIIMILRHYNTKKTWKQFYDASIDSIKGNLGKRNKYTP